MGTVIEIILQGDDEATASKAALQAFQEIKVTEQRMSPWVETSDVSRLNRSAGEEWVRVSPETLDVIRRSLEISRLSEGAFDMTVAPLARLWRKAGEQGVPPSPREIKKVLRLVNFKEVFFRPDGALFLKKRGMAVDLGGIAKGYAVDRAVGTLTSLGYQNLVVNAGGDLRTRGFKKDGPWSIGIQDPRSPEKLMATVPLSGSAMATSGDYEKYFFHQGKRYHHLIDPKTGRPADGCRSVTVLAKDAMTADAMATAVFILGPEKGYALCQKLEAVECFIVDREGRRLATPGLKEKIFIGP